MDRVTAGVLLRISGLSVDYSTGSGAVHALEDVDLEVAGHESLGVLGESGSGKSSLAHSIQRLLPHNAEIVCGSIQYRGQDLLRLPAEDLRRVRGADIALISQEPALALNPVLSIGPQMADVLRAHRKLSAGEVREKTRSMLREVGFTEPDRIMRAYPHQLSGGQRQRAAIAQALICGPSLLLADEPLSSLDTVTQAEIVELLLKLKRELNLAMLFITHNAGVLSGLADRVIVMRDGRICASGDLAELTGRADPYVQGLIAPEARLRAEVSGNHGEPGQVAQNGLLKVRDLSKTFVQHRMLSRKRFKVQALSGIDLDLPEAASVAVIGRSGSGKSTLARCIAGFENPDQGEVVLHGVPVTGPQRNVQLIFQDAGAALNPRFTAAEVIAEPLEIARQGTARQRRERAIQFMQEAGLDPRSCDRKTGEFSGGQKQRLALARALAVEPRLLILDESFSGLDVPLQAQMLELLLDLQKRHGLACLHISHDLNFIALFARQVIVMDEGRIVERAVPSALHSSSHSATRALVEASERLHAPGLEAVL